MTIRIDTKNLQSHIGQDAGVSDWFAIDQQRVNDFADVTKDHQFIHVDPVKAAQSPFGTTIAHGFLTLSMLAYFLQNGVGIDVPNRTMGVNYGFDKVRFLQPVKVGSPHPRPRQGARSRRKESRPVSVQTGSHHRNRG